MNLRIIRKNHVADSEIVFSQNRFQSNGCAMAMPTAWELTLYDHFFANRDHP